MKLGNPLSTAAFWSMLAWLLLWIIVVWLWDGWQVGLTAVMTIAGFVLARRARKAASRD